MSGRSLWSVVLAVFSAGLLVERFGYGDEPQAVPPAATTPEGDRDEAKSAAAIERTLDVIDLVLEHHIDPPTRPEMMQRIANDFCRHINRAIPQEFAQLADNCANRDRSRRFLTRLDTDLAPEIAAFNAGESTKPKVVPPVRPTRRLRGVADGDNVRVTFEGLLQEALSTLVPGGLEVLETKELKVQEQFQANRYVGIGVALGSSDDGDTYFARLFAGAPAEKGGIVEGDSIESIDGRSMKGLKLTEIVERLRGPQGTTLTIAVRSKGAAQSRTLTITRDVVPRSTVNGWGYVEGRSVYRVSSTSTVAYIRIGEIGGSTVDELRRVEQQLTEEGVKALVLDLRDTHGDAHHFAVLLADALLDGGTIGRIRTRERVQEFVADRECLFRGWPLAILINDGASNNATWLAAALKDNRRAVLVGAIARCKPYVYTSFLLPGGMQSLRLATGILERPSGKLLVQSTSNPRNEQRPPGASHEWTVYPHHVIASAPVYVGVPGNLTIRVLSGGPDEAGVKKACELLEALLDAPPKLVP